MHRQNYANPPNADNGNRNWRNHIRNNNAANGPTNNPQGSRGHQNNNRRPYGRQNRGGGNNRRPYSRDQSSTRFFNFNRLDELSKKDSNEVITILEKNKADFEESLNDVTRPDLLVMTLRVLTNVCRADFAEIVTSVLSHACSANFLKSLEAYLTNLPFENPVEKIQNKLYHEDPNGFWSNLIEFFKKIIELLPSKARDELTPILQKIKMITVTIEMSHDYKIDEKVKNDALQMFKDLEEEIRKVEEKNKARSTISKEPYVEEDPPEDFRSLSVIPTIQDLYNHKPFIRPCKIKDAYYSVEHYLDVQFRLLREDFVSPLRDGIQEYLHGPQKYRNNDLRIYRKVTLVAPQVDKNNVGIVASFGLMKQINWRRSKRFMFGGLLLLSNDNFNTVLFMTVANRDEKDLEKGYILIEPCEGTNITRDMYNSNFVMLESKIYFEPYLAVLSAMQQMNAQNFPMENYLVNADVSTLLPKYLARGQRLRYKQFQLPIGYDEYWPTARELKLDQTQLSAFRCALTQEFAVIQGPPGTGKTFIALEIVRTLLENDQYWKTHGPIVVVCLTNHALDQFLEGILQYTKSIVRVGSRSKSETLKPYTLMERRKFTHTRKKNGEIALMYETKHELESISSSMEKLRLFVKHLTTQDAIVPLQCLVEYCHDTALTEIKSNEELVNWLVGMNLTPLPESSSRPEQTEDLAEMMPEERLGDDENQHMDDELELAYKFQVDDTCRPIFPLKSMDALITSFNEKILLYRNSAAEVQPPPLEDPTIEWEEDLNTLNVQRMSLQRKLAQHPVLNKPRYPANSPRWRMYWKWVKFSYDNAMNRITELETTFRQKRSKLNEAKQLVDLATIREHKIIGLTTYGAAKLHASLRALHAPIVLVEEAAEILEAHVVCSLTKHCQHVILIGDHKQLRPKASVYQLGTKYNLNISLFERMVNIRGNCTQLAYQHRMRPQIAKLITPSVYETLHNHESVLDYPNVRGLEKNLFFLNHNNRETSHNNEESWVNKHEAVFLVAFARHLILQGYSGTEITILCTYTGQLFAFMKETARYAILKQVRVTTIDNYQGEENRIILLSLVRNNGEGNIGFLKEENRVCVALSRAREGLYIMGNMDDLVVKNNIWPKIKKVLESEDAIGDSLELRCHIHADQLIKIQSVNDFQKCPEGGCLKKCDADLLCGHSCTSTCHTLDREHEEYQCKQPCIHSCPNNHPCPLKCWQGCKPCREIVERRLKCGHIVRMPCSTNSDEFPCYIEVDAILPNCKHNIRKPCHRPIEKCECPHPCNDRLPCGHTCRLTCHVTADPDHIQYQCFRDCAKNNIDCVNNHPCKKRCHEKCGACSIIVAKSRSCGHHYKQIQCAVNVEDIFCERRCKRELICGHKCPQKCSEACGNCQVKVKKTSSCGHKVEVKCCEDATTSKCRGKCQLKLPCGHPCTARCKDPCTTKCETMVRQSRPGLCGHIFSVPCHVLKTESNPRALVKYCEEPCTAQLSCTHICGGKCGQCKQGRIHIPCAEPCGNILVCGHKCDVPCRQECTPCNKPCELKCRHNKCNNKCGIPCTRCQESCEWKCEHRECSKRCFELCDIEPCNVPCKKMLKCNHPCVGFCGDPCPPLCRICNNEELTELFLGGEDEPDARFVFLEDCSHCIESNGLMQWLENSSKSIQMKTCPRCTTPIRKCMRIMNHIKKYLKDVLDVKVKVFGNPAQLEKERAEHLETIQSMILDPNVTEFREFIIVLKKLWERGVPVRGQKRQILNSQEVQALKTLLDILREMIEILASIKKRTVNSYQFVKTQVITLLESLPMRGQISNQELEDIQRELHRLNYMAELCKIDAEKINDGIVRGNQKDYDAVIAKLLSVKKFTDTMRREVRSQIIELQKGYKTNLMAERQMIVKAMGFTQGHWFKCPNGHIYAIGECGGAMQKSQCPECKADIGGESHRLASGNALASEMDGARHSAWPGGP